MILWREPAFCNDSSKYQETCGWLYCIHFSASITVGMWWFRFAFCFGSLASFLRIIHDCNWLYSKIHEPCLNQITIPIEKRNHLFTPFSFSSSPYLTAPSCQWMSQAFNTFPWDWLWKSQYSPSYVSQWVHQTFGTFKRHIFYVKLS